MWYCWRAGCRRLATLPSSVWRTRSWTWSTRHSDKNSTSLRDRALSLCRRDQHQTPSNWSLNAVTRHFISVDVFLQSLLFVFPPFVPFPLSSPAAKWLLESSKGIWGALFASPSGGERHLQPPDTFQGFKYIKYAFAPEPASAANVFLVYVYRAQGTCLVAANVVLFLLNEIEKLKQIWLFSNVLYISLLGSRL